MKTGPNASTPRCQFVKEGGIPCRGMPSYPANPGAEVRCYHHNEHRYWVEWRERQKARRSVNGVQRRLFADG